MYCWLLLQIHLCYLWLLLCSRVTYVICPTCMIYIDEWYKDVLSFCSLKLTMSLEFAKSCHLQNSVNSKHAHALINMISLTSRLINISVFLKRPACVVHPDCSLISLQARWAACCFASFALFPSPSGYSFRSMTTLYTNLKKQISVFHFQL